MVKVLYYLYLRESKDGLAGAFLFYGIIVIMVSLIVKNIIEEDFGCEGRPAGYEPKCKVILRDFNGNEMEVDVKDADLYAKDINIGDQVHFDGDEIIKE